MKPKSIGIIGGAGPLAGTYLLQRVFSLAGKQYGCYRDADFPQVFLISFPFSEMLNGKASTIQLQKELTECITLLRANGANALAIACNTLHAFLEEEIDGTDLIHLPKAIKEFLCPSETPLVFCTSTSVEFGLHKQFFPCIYPDSATQMEVDRIIDRILRGDDRTILCKEFERLVESQHANSIVLGCTELSLFSQELSLPNMRIIDPIDIVATALLERSFSN